KVVMLAGGIGVTPFRAMIEDALTRPSQHDLLLIHSSRMPEEAPFLNEFKRWATGSQRVVYRPTMTQAKRSRCKGEGEPRRVDAAFPAHGLPADRNEPLFYVAGPERFVKGVVDVLKNLSVDQDRLRFEEFPGY